MPSAHPAADVAGAVSNSTAAATAPAAAAHGATSSAADASAALAQPSTAGHVAANVIAPFTPPPARGPALEPPPPPNSPEAAGAGGRYTKYAAGLISWIRGNVADLDIEIVHHVLKFISHVIDSPEALHNHDLRHAFLLELVDCDILQALADLTTYLTVDRQYVTREVTIIKNNIIEILAPAPKPPKPASPPSPPPPPAAPATTTAPPPPPPPPPPPAQAGSAPPPPPPPPSAAVPRAPPAFVAPPVPNISLEPIPAPSRKMKSLFWDPLPAAKLANTFWAAPDLDDIAPPVHVEPDAWAALEANFCQPVKGAAARAAMSAKKVTHGAALCSV